jgi:hypothetical protein
VHAALALNPRTIVLALGGSASTDGGAGLLEALGAPFLDQNSVPLPPDGGHLTRIARVDLDGLVDLNDVSLRAATDVSNPLTGRRGPAHVFGPQKGATPTQVDELDRGLANLARRRSSPPDPVRDRSPSSSASTSSHPQNALVSARTTSTRSPTSPTATAPTTPHYPNSCSPSAGADIAGGTSPASPRRARATLQSRPTTGTPCLGPHVELRRTPDAVTHQRA